MATVPTFGTFTAQEKVTAAKLNTNVRDAGNFFVSRPMALLRQTVAQSIPNGAFTSITFTTEDLDNDGGHSTVTNTSRYTAQTAGWYWVTGTVVFGFQNTGARAARLAVNGSALNASYVAVQAVTATAATALNVSRPVNLAAGDYVELQGFQSVSPSAALNTAVSTEQQSMLAVMWAGTGV